MKRKYIRVVIVWLLFIATMTIALYPSVSMYYNDKKYKEEVSGYHHELHKDIEKNPDKIYTSLQEADDYNKELSDYFRKNGWNLQDPWNGQQGSDITDNDHSDSNIDPGFNNDTSRNARTGDGRNPSDSTIRDHNDNHNDSQSGTQENNTDEDPVNYDTYKEKLNEYGQIGTLYVPSVDINLPIYHGTDEDTLFKGVGHMFGTSLPVGGVGTHAGLAAHSGVKNMTMFDRLPELKNGDIFYIETNGKVLKYTVNNVQTVLPHEVELMEPQEGKDLVTLITCVPYGVNSHRLLVTGERTFAAENTVYANNVSLSSHTVNKQNSFNINEFNNFVRETNKHDPEFPKLGKYIIVGGSIVALLLLIWTYVTLRDRR